MPAGPRPRREPTDDWDQLRLLVDLARAGDLRTAAPDRALRAADPRPRPRDRRARADPAAQGRPLRRRRHAQPLRAGPSRPQPDRRRLPLGIRRGDRRAEGRVPAVRPARDRRASAGDRFDRPVSHHTVEQVLAAEPLPLRPPRRFRRYHEIADPVAAAAGDRRRSTWTAGASRRSPATWRRPAPTVYDVAAALGRGGLAGAGRPLAGPAPPGPQGRPQGDGGDPPAAGQPRARRVPHPRRAGAAGHRPLARAPAAASWRCTGRSARRSRPRRVPHEPQPMPFAAAAAAPVLVGRRPLHRRPRSSAPASRSTSSRSWRTSAGRSWPARSRRART